ncbi:hypothetical protein [Sphingopyxis sp. GW247-27LB]|uniref:hypothetical protein n=1 Tax=Sphingopyxis sp. GW247-27LB TaxID=2012632 RepID=UPI000BA58D39|nr:hypothetical protein [Sphingopyxis sp. GW247-27LB]PAL23542.1 hypothetical protein CD928_05600 [Sphingopyxis sp. GW247-27LB]
MATTEAELLAATDKFATNLDRIDQIVNGDETTDVAVDGGREIPSFAKLAAENELSNSEALGARDEAVAAANGLASTLDYFPEIESANLADPARTDPALAATANQLWRFYQNAAGNMTTQDETARGTFAVLKRLPVTAGAQRTHSMKQGPANFIHYPVSGQLMFLKADGTTRVLAAADSGLNTHTVTFTPPADAVWWLPNVRNITNYANGTGKGITAAALAQVEATAMFNAGATALDYEPYAPAGARAPDTAQFQATVDAPITLEIRSDYTYVGRAAGASATYDVVDRLLTNEQPAPTLPATPAKTGVIDFQGRRRIAKGRRQKYMVPDFASGEVMQIGTDERTPIRINGVFLGASHKPSGYRLNFAGTSPFVHDKTNEDIGSTYTDTAGKSWMIVARESASALVVIATNTGPDDDKWIIGGTLTGATLTHAADGTNTGAMTGFVATAGHEPCPPIIRNLTKEIYADGVKIEIDAVGVYPCSSLRMIESYEIMNVAGQLAYLKANAGTATDPDYTNAAIGTQVIITDVHEWDRYGARVSTRTVRELENYRRTAFGNPGDYLAATQAQPAALTGDSPPGFATKKIVYVPRLSVTVGGYDLSARADLTANVAAFAVPKSAASDPANPPDYAASIGADGGGDLHGYIMGLRPNAGLGKPETRAAATNTLFYISGAEKLYGVAKDAAAGDGVAGDIDQIVGFIAPWAEADDDLTVPGALVPNGKGGYYCYVATTATLSGKAIPLPPELAGLSVSEHQSHPNITLLTDAVGKEGLILSVAAGGGDAIFEIGAS